MERFWVQIRLTRKEYGPDRQMRGYVIATTQDDAVEFALDGLGIDIASAGRLSDIVATVTTYGQGFKPTQRHYYRAPD